MEGFVPDDDQPTVIKTTEGNLSGFEADVDQPENLEAPMFPADSLFGKTQANLENRLANSAESASMFLRDEQTYSEATMQAFGQALMAYNDVVSNVGLEILSALTTDRAEEWLKELIDTGATELMSIEAAQDLYQMYQSLSPRARKDIDAAMNIGLSGLPMKKTIGGAIKKAGQTLEKNSIAKDFLTYGIEAKKARNSEIGKTVDKQYVLNREDDLLNTVLSVKGISSAKSRAKKMAAVNREIAKLGDMVKKSLASVPTTVSKGTVTKRVNAGIRALQSEKPVYAGKYLKEVVQKALSGYQDAMKSFNGRPEDLLRVRKAFDDEIQLLFKKDVHAGDDASRAVVAQIRNTMNDILQELAPDSAIKSSLLRHHKLLIAADNLSTNMAIDRRPVEKALSKLESHPFFVTGALSGTGIGSTFMNSPVLGEALGVGTGLLGAGYLATRPQVLKPVGSALDKTAMEKRLIIDMLNEQANAEGETQ